MFDFFSFFVVEIVLLILGIYHLVEFFKLGGFYDERKVKKE